MLTRISIERFKRFDKLALPLRSLTVLTGANGAGKTSLIHALLMVHQASRHPDREDIHLNGYLGLELGSSLDVLHVGAEPTLTVALEAGEGRTYGWTFRAEEDTPKLHLDLVQHPGEPWPVLAEAGRRFTYLAAERLGPRAVLPVDSSDAGELNVGHDGRFVAHVLAELEREVVPEARRQPDADADRLLAQVEAWMAVLTRPLEITARRIPDTELARLTFRIKGAATVTEPSRPPNMGFGVSYALPIVVAALTAPTDSEALLVVENPEAHLHPAAQSEVGRFLAQVAASGVQVLVETHSDHVINGIRRAVAEGKVLPPSDVAIHFFGSKSALVAEVTTIDVLETGQLSAWPSGFFDQLDQDLSALARARRGRS